MYAMMAPVEAGNLQACNVHFETPNLALPMIRELTEFEIDWVSGGIDYRQVLRAATVSAAIGGIAGAAGGAVTGAFFAGIGAGPGAAAGAAGGIVTGFIGGALINIAEQTGFI